MTHRYKRHITHRCKRHDIHESTQQEPDVMMRDVTHVRDVTHLRDVTHVCYHLNRSRMRRWWPSLGASPSRKALTSSKRATIGSLMMSIRFPCVRVYVYIEMEIGDMTHRATTGSLMMSIRFPCVRVYVYIYI